MNALTFERECAKIAKATGRERETYRAKYPFLVSPDLGLVVSGWVEVGSNSGVERKEETVSRGLTLTLPSLFH